MILAMGDQTRLRSSEDEAWLSELRRYSWRISEALGGAALTPDIEFVSFLRARSRFGFLTFGPVTVDVQVVEDLLERTHPRGSGTERNGGPGVAESYVRWTNLLYEEVRRSGRKRTDELHFLLSFMRWKEGLPARVFAELGVTPEQVESYARSLRVGEATPSERLLSTEEAAQYFGVHVQTVRSWIRSGKLPASRLAGQKSIRIKESDLRAVLEPIDPSQFED